MYVECILGSENGFMMILKYISYSNITTIVVVCDTDGLSIQYAWHVTLGDCVSMTENS